MKKAIILLALVFSVNVQAEIKYTDYELVGYTFEEKNDNELYKYEPVTMNRFYKLVRSDSEYLERGNGSGKEIDESDYKKETIVSDTPSETYDNTSMITIKGEDNYIANKVILSSIEDYKSIKFKEIEVHYRDQKIAVKAEYPEVIDGDLKTHITLDADNIDIEFEKGYYVDDIKVIIYFEAQREVSLQYTVNNLSGLLKISKGITLDHKTLRTSINTLRYDKYSDFINENNFSNEPIKYYYTYDKIFYKHYTPIKEYYTISEQEELENYVYNPDESFTMYKVYRREKIDGIGEEVKENDNDNGKDNDNDNSNSNISNNSNNSNNSSNSNSISNNKGNDISSNSNARPQTVTIKEVLPCTCEETTCEETDLKEESNSTAVLDTTKNGNSIVNLDAKSEKESQKVEDCTQEMGINWWIIIGVLLMFTSLILTIVHYIGVKREKNNG